MIKSLLFSKEGREKLKKGANAINDAVKVTLGAAGRQVMIAIGYEGFTSTKDGVTVANSIVLRDPVENMGANLVKSAAQKTVKDAGDGTSTSCILTSSIINKGLEAIDSGANPVELKKGIEKATGAVVDKLKELSKEIKDEQTLVQIATISANNDPELGKLIAEAVYKVGRDGEITVEESRTNETSVEWVGGMKFDRGLISRVFINNPQKGTCEMTNPYILVSNKPARFIKDVQPIVEKLVNSGRPALLIFDSIDGEALQFIGVNREKGLINVCVVRAPEFGDNRANILQDIALLTGAEFISEEAGKELSKVELKQLGTCERIVVDATSTLITNGAGDKDKLNSRCEELKSLIEAEGNEDEKSRLKSRLAKLKGGVAVIKVGGVTEAEMQERKFRIDDALCATRAADEEGYLAGGGVALLNAAVETGPLGLSGDQLVGASIVITAIQEPFYQILENAGKEREESASLGSSVHAAKEYGFGYNVVTEKIENLFDAGVIDPTKVVRCALENASSMACIFLTTECVITAPIPA